MSGVRPTWTIGSKVLCVVAYFREAFTGVLSADRWSFIDFLKLLWWKSISSCVVLKLGEAVIGGI